MTKKILITGGAGYIGSMVSTKLVHEGFDVTVIDKLNYDVRSLCHLLHYENFTFIEKDILDKKYLKNIIKKYDYIIPLAALVGAPLCEKFKKNPKFFMKLVTFDPARAPVKMRLTLSRYGSSWTNTIRHDAVGSMIGFYIFRTNQGDQELMYEGAFVPDREVSTPSDFTLEPLDEEEDYIVLCTTFTEGQLGNFVLSVSADCEVALTRGDAGR